MPLSCVANGLVLECSLKNIGIITKPIPQNGMLIQNIHRYARVSIVQMSRMFFTRRTHETFCAKAPPMTGPVTVPIAHTALMKPNHLPRSRRGTRSVTRISVRTRIPPPPMPCRDRPSKRTVKLFARAAVIAPAVKSKRAASITGLRPEMWEKEAKLGWNTVEVSRKDVPDQKA